MSDSKGLRTEPSFDWRRWLGMVRAQSTAVCWIIIVTALCGVILSYSLSKKYEASATVFLEQNVISDLVKGIAITPSIDAKMRILKVALLSRNMLLGVMRDLDMDLGLDTQVKQERYLDALRDNIHIVHDERKGLFAITYTDENPARARDFVNTLTRRYIEESTSSQRRESIDATSFLSEQIKVFQDRIELAQAAIDAFKSEKSVYLGLNEFLLREQIRTAEQRLEDVRIRKNECQAKLGLVTPGARLRAELEDKERSLRSLRAVYTDRHPQVLRAREDIRAASEALKAAEADGSGEGDVEYQRLTVELQSLSTMEASLVAAIEKNNGYLQELPEIRTELAALEQRKDNETLIYEQLVSRYGQSEVAKQMELQDKSVSFNIIDTAVLPVAYKSPPRSIIIAGAVLLGFALAGAFVLGKDLLRPKVRGKNDVEAFGVEVLAAIPPAEEKRAARPWKMPALAGMVVVFCLALAAMEFFRLPYAETAFSLVQTQLRQWI